jgi:hypothetical protein
MAAAAGSAETIVGGKYRLGRKLGGGSFGEIFLGEFGCSGWGLRECRSLPLFA